MVGDRRAGSTPAAVMAAMMAAVVAVVLTAGLLTACAGSKSGGGFTEPAQPHLANAAYGQSAHLTGPITTGHIIEPESGGSGGALPPGYVEQEFFASGQATAFRATATPADGRWTVVPSTTAPYQTRIVVRRPADPKRFNGTVVVEWLNVSAGESSPDWDYLNPALTAAGFAYVGVSAQALGVVGGRSLLGTGSSPGGLVRAEPARYGSLHHPGDGYSYDIFAQVGRALRDTGAATALGRLQPRHIVAVGESQSAYFLTTFANAVQPLTRTFDGLFIHSRGGSGAPIDGSTIASQISGAQQIRTDLDVPVFMFETETDLTVLGYAAAAQPDTSLIRTWEVPGTAHADTYIVGSYAAQLGCTKPINNGPQHEVVQAAFTAFSHWVSTGTAPPAPPPITLASRDPVRLATDANGNVLGGVRTPAVDVPVSTLSGVPAAGSSVICSLFGSSLAFTPAHLAAVYGNQAGYLTRFDAGLNRAVKAGYILPADQAGLTAAAHQVRIG
jgi:Alpha/beta hydrolase domain